MREKREVTKSINMSPLIGILFLIINIIFFCFIGIIYTTFSFENKEKLLEENIENIVNLNIAFANAAYTYTKDMGIKIDDTISFIKRNNLTYDEVVDYLDVSNTSKEKQYQLILCGTYANSGELSYGDYSGISLQKQIDENGLHTSPIIKPVSYGIGYYDILRSFTDITDSRFSKLCFTPEFTNQDTKRKCFAVYRHVIINDDSGQKKLYAILLIVDSKDVVDIFNMQTEYENQSFVLINNEGKYIVKNNDFRNTNFYDYIVNYNNLHIDRRTLRTEIGESLINKKEVNLFYKNHRGKDCVFSVTQIDQDWYSVTCVPVSSLNTEVSTKNYSLYILFLFILLFVIDAIFAIYVATIMNRNIKVAEKATKKATEASFAKSRFLSTMSHELRTPLNAIIGFVGLSEDSVNKPRELEGYLKKIEISSKLLLQIINDILDVSAIESNKIIINHNHFSLENLITTLSSIYYDLCAKKNIHFNVITNNHGIDLLIGDSVRLNQILLNFLSNAVKYTSNNGVISLNIDIVSEDHINIVFRFSVKDNGCGVNSELRTRIFQPFERASGDSAVKYSGTGLGLSIAKNLTELMNGKLGFESIEGKGSLFWVEIPFKREELDTQIESLNLSEFNVLCVLDKTDESDYLQTILNESQVKNSFVDNVDTALQVLERKATDFEAFNTVIIDKNINGSSTLDTVSRIREICKKKIKIIILSYDLSEDNDEFLEDKENIIYKKPIFISSLIKCLKGMNICVDDIQTKKKVYDLCNKKVLLVEDNLINIELARLILEKFNLSVEVAENGQLAYEKIIKAGENYYDLILIDIQMPVLNGYDATIAIRNSALSYTKSIPIIAMTADAFSDDVQKSIACGMNEHISKPIDIDKLYRLMEKYLS